LDILYSRAIEKHCKDRKSAVRKWGPEQGRHVMRRIDDLLDMENLAQLRCFPALRPHELTNDRDGQISIDLKDPYLLILEPANDPLPQKEDGGLDWERVTIIKIVEVVDTHEGKHKK
jgi:plasmid maintenance system killer protein